MRLLDPKFRQNKSYYVWQSLLAMVVMLIVMGVIDLVDNTEVLGAIGASALAASTFAVLCAGRAFICAPRNLIGGYFTAILIGALMHYLSDDVQMWFDILPNVALMMTAGLAVGSAVFIMSLLNVEHPPAAGLTLGLVIEPWNLQVLAVIMLFAILIAGLRTILRPYIRDLV